MTATAHLSAPRTAASPTRAVGKVLLAIACWCCQAPAVAQIGASVSLFSEASFRGYSLSEGRPIALLHLSYDHSTGLYGAALAGVVIGSEEGIQPLSLQLNAGYATRLPSSTVLDFGVTHSSYSRYASRGSSSYTEFYAAVSRKVLTARVSYAPHYFGYKTLYGEVDANFSPRTNLNLNAHLGILAPLDYPDQFDEPRRQHDWRLGAAHQVGRVSLHAFVTGGGPGRDYYRGDYHSRTRLVVGLSSPL